MWWLDGERQGEGASPDITGEDFPEINHEFIASLVGHDSFVSPEMITAPLQRQREYIMAEHSHVFQSFYERHMSTSHDVSEHIADLNQGQRL